jgi:hypothetical protein
MPDSSRRVLEGLQKLIPEVQSKNFSLRGAARCGRQMLFERSFAASEAGT